VWDAYWVPQRDAAGVAIPGKKTNLVYTADAVRGIEVFEVTLPARTVAAPPQQPAPAAPPPAAPAPTNPDRGGSLAATGLEITLPVAALVLLALAIAARRRTA
jgi:hypothetical protein